MKMRWRWKGGGWVVCFGGEFLGAGCCNNLVRILHVMKLGLGFGAMIDLDVFD